VSDIGSLQTTPITQSIGGTERFYRSLIAKKLAGLQQGEITITDALGTIRVGSASTGFPLSVHITVSDMRFYDKVLFGGSVGAGESYALGYWTCSDLVALVRIFVRNREVMNGMESGFARVLFPLLKVFHTLNRNTRAGSRKNISAHYDLGNEMFEQFLDPTMMYSSAYFTSPEATLEEGSNEKNDRICRKLRLTPQDHLVEIGTGWGGFAVHAAKHYGCRVTTTTISREQHEYAKARVRREGLEDRITLLLQDYRDLKGTFTKLVSIEMIEAVGWQYYGEFFRTCDRLLQEDGAAVIQAITIQDQHFHQARRSVDFIQRFIFPGSCIPSATVLLDAATKESTMKLHHFEDFAPHYARTLREWRERFLKNAPAIRALGYSEDFIRLWDFYFAYCEGGFEERSIGSTQLTLIKPQSRLEPVTL
jgi:cyclopropane-fatty-acyl-phospholipid synthase